MSNPFLSFQKGGDHQSQSRGGAQRGQHRHESLGARRPQAGRGPIDSSWRRGGRAPLA